jgi:phosphopantothenoylcysteine decarboxylase/phosphopantothenate--cysteine ligase
MYDHPVVIENVEKLNEIGVHVMGSILEEAKAKISSPEAIVEQVIAMLTPQDLEGKHFVVTAGPTRGWMDRVRFITNPSSGRMGIEIARSISFRGGTVDLVIGPTAIEPPSSLGVVNVETPNEMMDAVMKSLKKSKTTAMISAAAVLDYMPLKKMESKIASGKDKLSVDFEPTPKIIEAVREKYKKMFVVGFKVESEVTFGTDTNEVLIVGSEGLVKKVPLSSKRDVAKEIVDIIVQRIK